MELISEPLPELFPELEDRLMITENFIMDNITRFDIKPKIRKKRANIIDIRYAKLWIRYNKQLRYETAKRYYAKYLKNIDPRVIEINFDTFIRYSNEIHKY